MLKLARESIQSYFSKKQPNIGEYRGKFEARSGAFVTLTIDGELRGCIGYPLPIYPLWQAVSRAAVAAAVEDPRFPPLTESELEKISIEVSVLSVPELVQIKEPSEYLTNIEIGKDGLVIESGYHSGLLLPQVASEYNWGVEEFLENLCQKAGLQANAWRAHEVKIYKFQAQIFH